MKIGRLVDALEARTGMKLPAMIRPLVMAYKTMDVPTHVVRQAAEVVLEIATEEERTIDAEG